MSLSFWWHFEHTVMCNFFGLFVLCFLVVVISQLYFGSYVFEFLLSFWNTWWCVIFLGCFVGFPCYNHLVVFWVICLYVSTTIFKQMVICNLFELFMLSCFVIIFLSILFWVICLCTINDAYFFVHGWVLGFNAIRFQSTSK